MIEETVKYGENEITHLLILNANKGAFSMNAIHWPDNRNKVARKAWAACSGRTNYRKGKQGSVTVSVSASP